MLERGVLRRPALGIAALLLAGRAGAVIEPGPDPIKLGAYEWMGPAAIVVAADIVADDGKFVQAAVATPIKGGLAAGTQLLIDLKAANRDREEGTPALKLDRGHAYFVLLKPGSRGKNEPYPVFDLVRGTRGARAIPSEGREAVVDAATRLGGIQERKSDDLLWASLPAMLEDANPVLVDAALELYVKFDRETNAEIPRLMPLLESPRPTVRQQSVVLLGRILSRAQPADIPDRAIVIGELTGRARRDDVTAVRRAATNALSVLPDEGIDETLRTVSREDPDQDVRFEAEKSLYVRSLPKGGRKG
jgi:HEAT repeat protein